MWLGCVFANTRRYGIYISNLTRMVRLRSRQYITVQYGMRILSVRTTKAVVLSSTRSAKSRSVSWNTWERSCRSLCTMTSVFTYTKSKLHIDFWKRIRLPACPSVVVHGHLWCISWCSLPTCYVGRGQISPLRVSRWTKLSILERREITLSFWNTCTHFEIHGLVWSVGFENYWTHFFQERTVAVTSARYWTMLETWEVGADDVDSDWFFFSARRCHSTHSTWFDGLCESHVFRKRYFTFWWHRLGSQLS